MLEKSTSRRGDPRNEAGDRRVRRGSQTGARLPRGGACPDDLPESPRGRGARPSGAPGPDLRLLRRRRQRRGDAARQPARVRGPRAPLPGPGGREPARLLYHAPRRPGRGADRGGAEGVPAPRPSRRRARHRAGGGRARHGHDGEHLRHLLARGDPGRGERPGAVVPALRQLGARAHRGAGPARRRRRIRGTRPHRGRPRDRPEGARRAERLPPPARASGGELPVGPERPAPASRRGVRAGPLRPHDARPRLHLEGPRVAPRPLESAAPAQRRGPRRRRPPRGGRRGGGHRGVQSRRPPARHRDPLARGAPRGRRRRRRPGAGVARRRDPPGHRRGQGAGTRRARGDGGPPRVMGARRRRRGRRPPGARAPPQRVRSRHGAGGRRLPRRPLARSARMTWPQRYDPLGSPFLSTAVAALPIVALLGSLAWLRLRAHVAALVGLLVALLVATVPVGMPAGMAARSIALGAAYGLFPIGWIVLNVLFLYRLVERRGLLDALRRGIAGVTDDRRLQLLLVALSFCAFMEGAAGFGTPVAVTGGLLIALGFGPLEASGLSLIANTAPVAFGALGTPIVALQGVTGLDLHGLSARVGHQLPVFSLIVPFWLVWAYAGWRGMREVWPAVLVAGVSFAVPQLLVSTLHGPWLVDIVAAACSMGALVLFLRVWRPQATAAQREAAGSTGYTPAEREAAGPPRAPRAARGGLGAGAVAA